MRIVVTISEMLAEFNQYLRFGERFLRILLFSLREDGFGFDSSDMIFFLATSKMLKSSTNQ